MTHASLKALKVFNTLTKEKELFAPLSKEFVGMYVCGPTVYSNVHLGNIRTFTSFDIIYRYLSFLGYNVRYVRNITDVGHLEHDTDDGEDKIAKKAKAEKVEPMAIVHRYTSDFHNRMTLMNNLPVDIEPTATGHIIEQIQWIEELLDKGFAYLSNGSVYFDTKKYDKTHDYGILSGRSIEDTLEGTRALDAQSEKKNAVDFALWKKATPQHIMKWASPWSEGYPGWHLECSVMSNKYLGDKFDIHGGGIDLSFPHHECEIAQTTIKCGASPAKYWLHTNMLTVNGSKMSKSLGNSLLPEELFTGNHKMLSQGYSPMVLRFFMLQTHYSSTMDISDDALSSAKKGFSKINNALRIVSKLPLPTQWDVQLVDEKKEKQILQLCDNCYYAMNDDFNTAKLTATLFNMIKKINGIYMKQIDPQLLGEKTVNKLLKTFNMFVTQVLGLQEEQCYDSTALIESLLQIYKDAKMNKDYNTVDKLRVYFKNAGLNVLDLKTDSYWAYEE